MICSKCQTDNPDGAKFCRNCGSPLLACANCGAPMSPGDRFCTSCGQPVSVITATDEMRLLRLNTAAPSTLVNKIRAAEVSSDRKVVTALFADVVGSTALAEQMDAEDWAAIMNRAFDLLSPPIYRYEGTIARLLGDALLAFFGAPVIHEDDPIRAVRAGLELLDAARRYADEVRRDFGIEFAIRVGINTGPVVVGNIGSDLKYEYTAMGDAVNLAARMQSAARPMTVLISQHTAKFVAPFFELTDLGQIEVKGKSEPVRAHEVVAPKAAPGRTRGLSGLESQMVGRSAELSALRQLTTAVQAGAGRAAVVLGEPGMGKSRLISEWKSGEREKGRPIQWVEGQCVSYGRELAYHLVLSALRSLIGVSDIAGETETRDALLRYLADSFGSDDLEVYPYLAHMLSLRLDGPAADQVAALDPQSLQGQYVEAFRRLLRTVTAKTPLTMILEDVHWADPSSVDLLTKLLPLVFQSRLLFCFVSRAERDTPGWKLIAAARELLGDTMLEIRLNPLSETDSQQLISNLLEVLALPDNVRALIYRKAEGNPFFVEEVIRMLIDRGMIVQDGARWVAVKKIETVEIPDNLLGLLLARIDRQPDDVKRTMRIASVIGRQFPVKVLEQVMEQSEAESLAARLTSLEAASLIRLAQVEPDLEYLFRHALIQDAAYESLLKKDRQRLHLAVGRILEQVYPERLEELSPVLGYHFAEGGDPASARNYWRQAGETAARKYANSEAITHYSRTIELIAEGDPALLRLYRARALIYETVGDFDAARDDHEAIVHRAQRTLNLRAEWQATLDLGFLWSGRDYRQAGDYFQRAFRLAEELGDPLALAHSLNRVGNWHANHEEPLEGVRYHQRALDIFKEVQDTQGIADTLDLLAMGSWLSGRIAAGTDYYYQALALYRTLGNQQGLAQGLVGIGAIGSLTHLSATAEIDASGAEALQLTQEGVEITRQIGWRGGEAYTTIMLGSTVSTLGDYEQGIKLVEHALAIAHEIAHHQWIVFGTFTLGTLYLDIGAISAARELVEPILTLAQSINSLYWVRMVSSLLVRIYAAQGDFQAGEQTAAPLTTATAPIQTFSERAARFAQAELDLARGDLMGATRDLDSLVQAAKDSGDAGEEKMLGISLLRGKTLVKFIQTGADASAATAIRAEASLRLAQSLAEFWPKPAFLWQAHAALSKLYRLRNRGQEAEHEQEAAQAIRDQLAIRIPAQFREEFIHTSQTAMEG